MEGLVKAIEQECVEARSRAEAEFEEKEQSLREELKSEMEALIKSQYDFIQ